MKSWIFDRLAENSTYRGLILLCAVAGIHFRPEQETAIISTALALVGLINVFRTATTPGGQFNPQASVRKAEKA